VEHKTSDRKLAIAAALAFEIAPTHEMDRTLRYLEAPGCVYSMRENCTDPTRASVFNYERRYCRLALKRPKGTAYQLSIFKYCAEVRRVAHFYRLDPDEVRLALLGRHFLKLSERSKNDSR
jgi:hypothetical protein